MDVIEIETRFGEITVEAELELAEVTECDPAPVGHGEWDCSEDEVIGHEVDYINIVSIKLNDTITNEPELYPRLCQYLDDTICTTIEEGRSIGLNGFSFP